MKRTTIAFAVLIASLAGHAQANESEDKARAAALYQEGLDAQENGDHELARQRYTAALALLESYKIAANLGAAELHLGRHAEAATHLQRALELLGTDAEPGARARIEQLLAEARREVLAIALTVELAGKPIAADVSLDGAPTAAGRYLFAAPGRHVVSARLGGASASEVVVAGPAGAETTAHLHLFPAGRAPTSSPAGESWAWPAWALSGGVAVFTFGAAIGLGLGVHYGAERDAIGDTIVAGGGVDARLACSEGEGACADWRDAEQLQTAMFGVGIASAVAAGLSLGGLLTFQLWPDSDVAVGLQGITVKGSF